MPVKLLYSNYLWNYFKPPFSFSDVKWPRTKRSPNMIVKWSYPINNYLKFILKYYESKVKQIDGNV